MSVHLAESELALFLEEPAQLAGLVLSNERLQHLGDCPACQVALSRRASAELELCLAATEDFALASAVPAEPGLASVPRLVVVSERPSRVYRIRAVVGASIGIAAGLALFLGVFGTSSPARGSQVFQPQPAFTLKATCHRTQPWCHMATVVTRTQPKS